MELIPIRTKTLLPPQDDLRAALRAALPPLAERDVLCLSSKVVAIHEGRAVLVGSVAKTALIAKEADLTIPRPYWPTALTVRSHAFLGAAGIDESNGNGHYILLPEDAFVSARFWWEWLGIEYGLSERGVVIVDSHSTPFRFGATGIAIGWHGFSPLEDCRGKLDIFGRPLQYERSNIVDGLAAAATVLMGETNEQIPAVVVRDIPRLTFTDENTTEQLLVPFKDDTFRVLYEKFLP